jgi:hypothetical protein
VPPTPPPPSSPVPAPSPPPDAASPRAAPLAAEPPCIDLAPRPAPLIIAAGIDAIVETPSPASPVFLGWATTDGHHHQLSNRSLLPVDRGEGVLVADERYQYDRECQHGCDRERSTSLGRGLGIVRVDPVTGQRLRLTRAYSGISTVLPYREHVYWGTYPHAIGGGVYRVHRGGGDVTELWSGDKVGDLVPYRDGILVIGERRIAWLPASGGAATIVTRRGRSAAVVAGDAYYVAEYGDPYWDSADSGSIRRIPRTGGRAVTLAGPLRWPTAIAVRGDAVYFVRRESSTIWMVPTTGGAVRAAIPSIEPDGKESPCAESLGLWADDRGLFYLRGQDFIGTSTLYHVPWADLATATTSPGRTPAGSAARSPTSTDPARRTPPAPPPAPP